MHDFVLRYASRRCTAANQRAKPREIVVVSFILHGSVPSFPSPWLWKQEHHCPQDKGWMRALVPSNKDKCQADLCSPVFLYTLTAHVSTLIRITHISFSSPRDSTAFSPSAALEFSGSNQDRLGQSWQNYKCPVLSTLMLWLVCSSDGKIHRKEGCSGGYSFGFSKGFHSQRSHRAQRTSVSWPKPTQPGRTPDQETNCCPVVFAVPRTPTLESAQCTQQTQRDVKLISSL